MVTTHEPIQVLDGREATNVVTVTRPGVKHDIEAIGTFFLVFTELGIGAVLMVMIYAGRHLSGGHYNPVVAVRDIVDPARVATTATLMLSQHTLLAVFAVELLFTFALCYVVLNVATSKDHPDNSFYGLATGFTLLAGAFAVGAIYGGAFNPSVTLDAAVMGLFAWPTLWVYLVAQVIGGLAAGVTFLTLNADDR
jgi:aquaporin Z